MPSIRPRPSQPSFYPDWSTLAYAFEGFNLGSREENKELLSLVHRASQTFNLCLSFAHLIELLGGTRSGERRARAIWIDSLDVVWLHDLDKVQDLEMERVLRQAAGLTPPPLGLPAAPSFLAQFPWVGNDSLELLRTACVEQFVTVAGDNQGIRGRMESFKSQGPMANIMFFRDRHLNPDDVSLAVLHSNLDAKMDQHLREEAVRINRDMASDPKYRIDKGGILTPPDDEFAVCAVRSLAEMRHDLPSRFVFHRAVRNAGDHAGRKLHVGTKWFKHNDRKGDVLDWWHLIGAAYCDVFTCDNYTSTCLDGARRLIGRADEIVFRDNDLSRLVRDLQEALKV